MNILRTDFQYNHGDQVGGGSNNQYFPVIRAYTYITVMVVYLPRRVEAQQ